MKKLWRNWPVHNLISHPLSEIVYWVIWPISAMKAEETSQKIHDFTLPQEESE